MTGPERGTLEREGLRTLLAAAERESGRLNEEVRAIQAKREAAEAERYRLGEKCQRLLTLLREKYGTDEEWKVLEGDSLADAYTALEQERDILAAQFRQVREIVLQGGQSAETVRRELIAFLEAES